MEPGKLLSAETEQIPPPWQCVMCSSSQSKRCLEESWRRAIPGSVFVQIYPLDVCVPRVCCGCCGSFKVYERSTW